MLQADICAVAALGAGVVVVIGYVLHYGRAPLLLAAGLWRYIKDGIYPSHGGRISRIEASLAMPFRELTTNSRRWQPRHLRPMFVLLLLRENKTRGCPIQRVLENDFVVVTGTGTARDFIRLLTVELH